MCFKHNKNKSLKVNNIVRAHSAVTSWRIFYCSARIVAAPRIVLGTPFNVLKKNTNTNTNKLGHCSWVGVTVVGEMLER